MKHCFARHIFAITIAFLPFADTGAAEESGQRLQQIMKTSSESLTYMVGAVLDGQTENDPAFLKALAQLESATHGISDHTNALPYSFDPVTRSLEDSVNQMTQAYNAGFSDIGESYLVETVSHCATCHMQSPGLASSLDTDNFAARILEEKIETSLAAQLLVAVRRIPEALKLWENRLLDTNYAAGDRSSEITVLEYISSVVHFNSNPGKATSVLQKFSERQNSSYYLPRKITSWIKQLEYYQTLDTEHLSLEFINQSLDRCRELERRPLAGNYPVCNIIGSALSSQMLRQNNNIDPETEGALYLNIGVYRMNTGLNIISVPGIEVFLEAAILASPGSEAAKSAYAHIEELAYLIYGDIDLADEVMDISIAGLRKIALD